MEQTLALSNDAVKEKLKNGEPLEGVTIDTLTLTKYTFDKPVVLTDCRINFLDVNRATFHEDVILRRCKINTLILRDASFAKKCDFKKSTIHRIRANGAFFQGGLQCAEAHLAGSFHKCIIAGTADFGWSRFESDAQFTEVQFRGDVDFRSVRVKGNGLFERAQCRGRACFQDVAFEGELKFRNSTWTGDLVLNRSQVKLGFDLTGATLEGITDLSDMTVGRTINLTGVQLGRKQGFRFMGVVAAAIALERKTVEGHVHPEEEKNYREAAAEYGFLRIMFKRIHRYEDEDWAYYQYKRMERKSKSIGKNPLNIFVRLLSLVFLDLGCGYGTRPYRTLGACACMVLFFAVCYLFAITPETRLHEYGVAPVLNRLLNAFDFSLMAFSGSYSDLPFSGGWRIMAMFEFMLGVVFLGLFIVSLSRKVIR